MMYDVHKQVLCSATADVLGVVLCSWILKRHRLLHSRGNCSCCDRRMCGSETRYANILLSMFLLIGVVLFAHTKHGQKRVGLFSD